jgi:signal peptidase I
MVLAFEGAEPTIREQLVQLTAALAAAGGGSLATCGVALDRIDRVRIAIGEPFRLAAEIDGAIDHRGFACVLGSQRMSSLATAGITVRDRPGGLTIERALDGAPQAAPAVDDLVSRCVGTSCGAARLGPPGREIWVELRYGAIVVLRVHGPGFHGAAALASAINAVGAPTRGALAARDEAGTLAVEMRQTDPDALSLYVVAALALRRDVLEAFRIPAVSMAPTLMQGDHLFIAKGAWRGPLAVGDLLVYRNSDGSDYVKRLVARGGQTVTQTARGLEIDGVAVRSEVVDPEFELDEVDDNGVRRKLRGSVSREHLNQRSYLVVHTQQVRPGTWTVPPGRLFFLGDNRENSNDSRYADELPSEHDVRGRVVGLWYAERDGLPDWNRIGTAPE